jgi:hypothetical protein
MGIAAEFRLNQAGRKPLNRNRERRVKLILVFGLAACLVASHGVAQSTGTAPGCCGLLPIHDSSQKSMVGTAVNSTFLDLFHRL